MRAICLYLHIHQPWRYREYSVFESGHRADYFEDKWKSKQNNERIFRKVAEKSYRSTLAMLEANLARHPGFKVSLSITGTWLEQAERWAPELIQQIRRMVETGRVEIVAETYYHSLAFFYNREEFEAQVEMHRAKVRELFGVETRVFRNTELAYNDELGKWVDEREFLGVLAEGWDKVLDWRSPNYVYRPQGARQARLLLKNYRLSDDIAFRFSDRKWKEWPLTVEKYLRWVEMDCLRGKLINLFMDFETFGEHQWADTGIFGFMNEFIARWLGGYENKFLTVSEACETEELVSEGEARLDEAGVGRSGGRVMSGEAGQEGGAGDERGLMGAREKARGRLPVEISMPRTVTWADMERDLSAWMGNAMQGETLRVLYEMREKVLASGDEGLIRDWRRLTTSDHAYYMCTKYWNDGDVHAYFSAYDSPYDAFIYYMNVVRDIQFRLGMI